MNNAKRNSTFSVLVQRGRDMLYNLVSMYFM